MTIGTPRRRSVLGSAALHYGLGKGKTDLDLGEVDRSAQPGHGIRLLSTRGGLVVVVSDLLDDSDRARELRALGVRHDVVVAHLTDPREDDLPPVGLLTLSIPSPVSATRFRPPVDGFVSDTLLLASNGGRRSTVRSAPGEPITSKWPPTGNGCATSLVS